MSSGVPQTGVVEEADLKKLTGLDTLSPPEDQLEIRMGRGGGLSANPYIIS